MVEDYFPASSQRVVVVSRRVSLCSREPKGNFGTISLKPFFALIHENGDGIGCSWLILITSIMILACQKGKFLARLTETVGCKMLEGSACTPKYLPHFLPNAFYFFSFLQGNFRTPNEKTEKHQQAQNKGQQLPDPFLP